MSNTKLNGSVDVLAKAMRDVFSEAMEGTRNAMVTDLSGVEDRLTDSIKTTNSNMQAQFAEQESKLHKLLSDR